MYRAKIFKNGKSQVISQSWLDIYDQMIQVADFMEKGEDLPVQERGFL